MFAYLLRELDKNFGWMERAAAGFRQYERTQWTQLAA